MGLERIRRVSPVMPVTPRRIYDAWLSSEQHTAFTGAPADVSARKGAKFTAHAGYIQGTNVELERGTRIVQTWRTKDFPEDAEDSQLEITFLQTDSGTRIVINHGGIPEGQGERYHAGWGKNYFKPMSRYFLNHREAPEVLERAARSAATRADAETTETAAKPAPEQRDATANASSRKPAPTKTPASKPGTRRKAPGSGDDAPPATRQRAKSKANTTSAKKPRRAAPAAASTTKSTAKSKTRKPVKRKSG